MQSTHSLKGAAWLGDSTLASKMCDLLGLTILLTNATCCVYRYAEVADFGCSKLRRTLRTMMSIDRGTINWSAPEVLRGTSDYTAVGTIAQLLHSFS
jgi:hypothetical protein